MEWIEIYAVDSIICLNVKLGSALFLVKVKKIQIDFSLGKVVCLIRWDSLF